MRRATPSQAGGLRAALNLSAACTVAGTALWCYGAVKIGHITPGIAGFLPKISPLWYAGLILLLAAIALARHKPEAHAMSAVLSLVVAVTLTPALAYGMPRSQSAAKHVDLVQWILSVHYLDPASGIYQAFSGFFSGVAWVCDVAHFPDVMGIATYWPLIVGLVGFAELRFFFSRLGFPSYRIWVGMTFVVLVNAIGADYFSPQSVGIVMGIGIFGLVLGRDWQARPGPGTANDSARDGRFRTGGHSRAEPVHHRRCAGCSGRFQADQALVRADDHPRAGCRVGRAPPACRVRLHKPLRPRKPVKLQTARNGVNSRLAPPAYRRRELRTRCCSASLS